jgi:hypothetical protein
MGKPKRWPCIGCGKTRARRPRRYCVVCKRRLKSGIALDIDDVPTMAECERIIALAI